MNLKNFATPYTVPNGALKGVTAHILPYRTLSVDLAIHQLEQLVPHFSYVSKRTGERTTTKPDDLTAAEKRAAERIAMTHKAVPVKTDWQTVDLWDTRMNTFVGVLPLIVAVDWPETLTPEAAVFKQFWEANIADPAERWQVFSTLIGTATSNALWDAFLATRSNPAPGAPELAQEVEPSEAPLESAGAPLTEATKPTSARSPTR